MDLVEIEINQPLGTTRYGGLGAGDILRTDKRYARHLVDELGVATYYVRKARLTCGPVPVEIKPAPTIAVETKEATPPVRKRKSRAKLKTPARSKKENVKPKR